MVFIYSCTLDMNLVITFSDVVKLHSPQGKMYDVYGLVWLQIEYKMDYLVKQYLHDYSTSFLDPEILLPKLEVHGFRPIKFKKSTLLYPLAIKFQ